MKLCEEGNHMVERLFWSKKPNRKSACLSCSRKYGMPIGNYKILTKTDTPKISTSKSRTKINNKSDKQKKIDAAYSVLRPQFLKARPYCEARLEGCTGQAEHVHHQYMGSNKRKHYLNTLTWTPICHHCHTMCHDKLSTEEQIEKGLRILD